MKKTENESSKTSGLTSRGKVLSAVLLTIFLNLFLFHRNGSVTTVLILGGYFVFGITAFLNRELFRKNNFLYLGLIAVNLLFSLSILLFDNSFSKFVIVVSWFLTTSFSIYLFLENKPFFENLEEMILAPINMGVSYLINGISIVGRILAGNITDLIGLEQRPNLPLNSVFRLIVGVAISIPVIGVLIGLLSSGDPVFAYKVTRVFQEIGKSFDPKFWFQPVGHLIFSAMVLSVLLPLALIKLRKIPLKYIPTKLPHGTEIAVILGLVSVVLGSFLIIDYPYVFATVAETSLSKFGVATYSEYVNRGFFEFSLVSVIVYVLLWVGLGALRAEVNNQKSKIKMILSGFQIVLFVEFAIFIISIFRRIFLYQEFHGWSLARIYGGIFLLWVLGMVVVLAIRHFSRKSLLLAEVLITLGIIVFVGLFNSENFIVSTHPPTVNKRIDYVYLSRMSTDGYAGWKQSYDYAKKVLSKNWLVAKEVCTREGQIEINGVISNQIGCVEKKAMYVVDREGRREIAYAGIVTRNLLGSYLQLVWEHGTKAEKEDLAKKVHAKSLNHVDVSYSEYNFFYNNDPGFRGFIMGTDIPISYKDREQDSVLDYFYNWNFSRQQAFALMKEEMPITKLLDLQRKYVDNYKVISTQPESERDYDMDISTLSPLLGD